MNYQKVLLTIITLAVLAITYKEYSAKPVSVSLDRVNLEGRPNKWGFVPVQIWE